MNDEQDLESGDSPEVATPIEEDAGDGGNEAQQQLQRAEDEIKALKDEVLRARAEVDNVRKRAERDVEAAHKYGLERLVHELLPVKDSLDLGLSAVDSAADIETLKEGMSMTAKMFGDFFEKLHIQSLDPAGEPFNPEFHQAMSTEETSAVEPGAVVRVMQKGYVLNDRLVRPALVIVAKAPAEPES